MAWSTRKLDARAEEILVDAYGDSEQLSSFECVLSELLDRPVSCEVLGRNGTLTGISVSDHGPVLQAKVEIEGRPYRVDLLEVTLSDAGGELGFGIAAYERWARPS